MAEDNLFSRVKNAIRGQKSSFCSRSTKVTILGYDNMMDPKVTILGYDNMMDPIIQYTNCDGVVSSFTYLEILGNGGYIDDCVQGGCPISFVDNNVEPLKGISRSNGPRLSDIKLFVQYGTTDCNTPPPPPTGSNLIVVNCSKGDSFVIDPSGFTLQKDEVYFLSFNNGVVNDECYTIVGYTTSQAPIDSLRNDPGQAYNSCLGCQSSLS